MNSEIVKEPKESKFPKAPFGKVRLTMEYDGTGFNGWQRQSDDIRTVQGTLEDAFSKIFESKIHVMGSGRTDAGVHAHGQVAHFIAPRDMRAYTFIHMTQSILPHDITILKAELMPADFHAQKSATSKTYIYKIWNEPVPSALRAGRSLWIRKPLNIERLNLGCRGLLGTHDFNCFRSEGSSVRTTVRHISEAKFIKSAEFVEFHISGSGFLKHMVRNIVGTLLQIEMNGRDPESIPKLIASGDRTQAGPTVEAQGLYLSKVFYSPDLDKVAQPL